MRTNLQTAIDMVDNEEVIDLLGVPKQRKDKKVYILCPGHKDTHFGSCYLDQKSHSGYFCYACGKYVNKFKMVQQITGWDNRETAKWFFDAAGVEPDRKEKKEADLYQQVVPLIRELSAYIPNEIVYDDICPCEKQESAYHRTQDGEYMISKIGIQNPLLDLYKTDKSMFASIVIRKLNRKINKFCRLLKKMNEKKKEEGEEEFLSGVSDSCIQNIDHLMKLRERVNIVAGIAG